LQFSLFFRAFFGECILADDVVQIIIRTVAATITTSVSSGSAIAVDVTAIDFVEFVNLAPTGPSSSSAVCKQPRPDPTFYIDAPFQLSICTRCGHGHVHARPAHAFTLALALDSTPAFTLALALDFARKCRFSLPSRLSFEVCSARHRFNLASQRLCAALTLEQPSLRAAAATLQRLAAARIPTRAHSH